jgi:4'-phosphopantetheinyl transferase
MSKTASLGNSLSQTRAESGEIGSIGSSVQRQTHSAAPTSEEAAWKFAEPVAIWFRVTQSLTAEEVDQARSTLSSDERARCDRLVFERDRRDFAAAHALLRDALSRHGRLSPGDWKFGVEAGGKPYLADQSELQFNIAHTRGLVVCALSLAGPIGVDVEAIAYERDIDAISERYFAPTELADLRARHDVARRGAHFTELWTSKEAYLKALGAGLRRPLDEIAFQFPGASEIRAASESAPIHADWRFGLFAPRSDFRLAVAVRAESPLRFLAREWPEKPDRPGLAPIRWSR